MRRPAHPGQVVGSYNAGAMRASVRQSGSALSRRGLRAFTLIELLVVAGVILLLLGIGVPAFRAMSAQARQNRAESLVSGLLNRASVVATISHARAAVRFAPAEWLVQSDDSSASASAGRGRQAAALYEERTFVGKPESAAQIIEDQRFEPATQVAPVLLPGSLWVAPAAALEDRDAVRLGGPDGPRVDFADRLLTGTIGHFAIDPVRDDDLLAADDFFVVFDSQRGLVPDVIGQTAILWPLSGYDPTLGRETAGVLRNRLRRLMYDPHFQRFGADGLIFYDRELLRSLGPQAAAQARRDVLGRARLFAIQRFAGTLIAAQEARP